jgi:hypothetical protein
MTTSEYISTFILLAGAAAAGTIIAMKYSNTHPPGGVEPRQQRGGYVQYPGVTNRDAAPVAQNSPITEAAYNQEPNEWSNLGESDHLLHCAPMQSPGYDAETEVTLFQ